MAGEPILVVDDNLLNRTLVEAILADDYDVRTAEDAEAALDLLASLHPRLILMDLQLPRMDGLTLTRRLKADPATQDIVIIAVTAYAMKGDEARARAAGCDDYISKPIDTRALSEMVARHLEKPRP